MPDALRTRSEVIYILCTATTCLQGFRKDPRRALATVEPLQSCEAFLDTDEQATRILKSMICAVTADCYLQLKQITEAADWYRRATTFSKEGGYPAIYADMVVRHKLADHYQIALDCLVHNEAAWRAHPLWRRVLAHIMSQWWVYPSMWRLRLRERSLRPRLEALLRESQS